MKNKSIFSLTLLSLCLVLLVITLSISNVSATRFKGTTKPALINPKELYNTCQALGDPHYIGFDGRTKFDFMGLGDYVLAQTKNGDFTVHTRTSKWGGATSVQSNVGVRLGDSTFEYDVEQDAFFLDGVKAPFEFNQQLSLGSGRVHRINSNTIVITSHDGIKLTMSWFRNLGWKRILGSVGYINVVIDAPKNIEFSKGLCKSKSESTQKATGILHNHQIRRVTRSVNTKKETPKRSRAARKVCKKAGLSKKKNPFAWRACVKDAIQSGNKLGLKLGQSIKKLKAVESKVVKKAINKKVKRSIKWAEKQELKLIAQKEEKKQIEKCSRRASRRAIRAARRVARAQKKLEKRKQILEQVNNKIKKARQDAKKAKKEASRKAARKQAKEKKRQSKQ